MFVCEATYLEATPAELVGHGHLTGTLAGELAAQVDARSLLLTHFALPGYGPEAQRQATAVYNGPIGVAVPGTTSG